MSIHPCDKLEEEIQKAPAYKAGAFNFNSKYLKIAVTRLESDFYR
jgi:hypothetical protein